jgi:hypothetical protein
VEEAFANLQYSLNETGKPIKALHTEPIDEYQSLM